MDSSRAIKRWTFRRYFQHHNWTLKVVIWLHAYTFLFDSGLWRVCGVNVTGLGYFLNILYSNFVQIWPKIFGNYWSYFVKQLFKSYNYCMLLLTILEKIGLLFFNIWSHCWGGGYLGYLKFTYRAFVKLKQNLAAKERHLIILLGKINSSKTWIYFSNLNTVYGSYLSIANLYTNSIKILSWQKQCSIFSFV